MKSRPDLAGRLANIRRSLESISAGQRFDFRSLISNRSTLPGDYDLSASVGAGESFYRITATPLNSTNRLPLNLEVRYRVGNPIVLDAPDYNTTTRFTAPYRKPPTDDGVHILDFRYVTPSAHTVYFKVIATGMDDYAITIAPHTP
jgi:hypothetical protein